MDLLSTSRLFLFNPTEKNKKFTNVFTRNISELAALKLLSNVVTKETSQMFAADTVAFTETANKFSQSFIGLIYRCRI